MVCFLVHRCYIIARGGASFLLVLFRVIGYLLSSAMNEDALNIFTAGVYVVKIYWSNGNIEVNKIVKQ